MDFNTFKNIVDKHRNDYIQKVKQEIHENTLRIRRGEAPQKIKTVEDWQNKCVYLLQQEVDQHEIRINKIKMGLDAFGKEIDKFYTK